VAKKAVVEIVCDRCERTEYIPPEEVKEHPDLSVRLGFEVNETIEYPSSGVKAGPFGTEVQFNELCSSCKKTVKNLFEQMTKKISWKRNKGEPEEIVIEQG
jgi:hypothetical protein